MNVSISTQPKHYMSRHSISLAKHHANVQCGYYKATVHSKILIVHETDDEICKPESHTAYSRFLKPKDSSSDHPTTTISNSS